MYSTVGPGKSDAESFLDGKVFNPEQVTNGKVTGTNLSGVALMPNAGGLPGHSLHTWTGGWGTVTYWNAFVAVEELHGIGTFFDERFTLSYDGERVTKTGHGVWRHGAS